eukprot:gene28490-35347_t
MLVAREYFVDLFSAIKRSAIDSDTYFCLSLNVILTLYFWARIILIIISLSSDHLEQYSIRTEMGLLMILVVVTAVVPGRIVRKRLLTVKNQMETNKTFVRYISHEIRSPLSTTSLGLDYLLDQFKTNPQLTMLEVQEVVRDAKVTCEIATSTLNDLLMFDKMETGMLDIAPLDCNAHDFVADCVKAFKLQALTSEVNLNCFSDQREDNVEDLCESCIGFNVDKYKMEQVLRNVNKVLVDKGTTNNNGGVLPYLPLPELRSASAGSHAMSNRSIIALIALAVLGFLVTQTFYTVDPTKQVLVRQRNLASTPRSR